MMMKDFPREGFVRLRDILAPVGPIPISKSAWWAGVATGRFPKPIKLAPRTTVWRVEDIRALFEGPSTEATVAASIDTGPARRGRR
jgi:predicted DNA-binding transcriptional regulator AlpA